MKRSQLLWTWAYSFDLAENRERWQAHVKAVMNIWVP